MKRFGSLLLALVLVFGLIASAIPAASAVGDTGTANSTTGRSVISFNNDWRFYEGDWPEAQAVDADDSQWLYVNTPHSTILYTPEHYYHEDLGIFWYRRHFTMDSSMEGKVIILTFEGAMQKATVWLNGEELGVHQGGYTEFAFDISDKVKFGEENVLAVQLDTRPDASFAPGKTNPDFQYFGGIYRDVYVTVTEPVYITDPIESNTVAGGGVFLTAPSVSKDSATVTAKTQVENLGSAAAEVTLVTEILDGTQVVAKKEDSYSVPEGEKYTFDQDLIVSNPRLWSVNTPELYTVRTTLKQGETVLDSEETTYGIRKVEWKRDGCYINGERVELVGVNLHSETYMLGNAQSNDAIFAEIKRLREYGFNFIRMSHYPHDPAFYEACDRYGVAVLDCLAGWQNYNDSDAFKNNTYEQMRAQIRVNRNHACVVAWEPSLNESSFTAEWARNMHNLVKEEYPEEGDSKAYTSGWKSWDIFDIGVGTPQANVVNDANTYSNKPVVVSEYGDWNFGGYDSTTRVTREPQHYDDAKGGDEGMLVQCDNIQSSFAFNRGLDWYGATAYWDYADYAGFDVDKLTYCGVVDVARIPKFGAYFFQSQTDPALDLSDYGLKSGPMVFIANTWADDSPNQVRIFSNCDEVELFVNGVSVGKQSPDTKMWAPHGDTSNPTGMPTETSGAYVSTENLEHPPFTFNLSGYTPGEGTLRAVAYLNGNEEPVAEFTRSAPGEAAQITLTAEDENPLKLDGSSAKLVWVDVRDENGTVVNTADNTITFETEGPGFVIGQKSVAVRGGQWAVWVRSTRGEGNITLTATADGLTPATITIPTQQVDGLPEKPEGGDADETKFTPPAPPAEPVNIFLNKAASASSENTPSGGSKEQASYANDGDEDTKWCASNPSPSDAFGTHWWQADLGTTYTVEEMKIVFDAAGSWKYHVAVSDDPEFTGYQIPENEISTTENKEVTVQVNEKGRYVRLYLNCPASNLWPCLREVSGTGYTDNVALGKPATASHTDNGSSPALAVDGKTDTFWNSGANGPAWYQVDLGGAYAIDEISLTFAWADPADKDDPVRHSFTLQASMDGQTWTNIGTWSDMERTGNDPNITATVETSAVARYLRVDNLLAKLAGTQDQWAEIAEFVALGTALGESERLDYDAPVSATSSAEGSQPSYGNDGNPKQYWVPADNDTSPSWQFDAGGLYQLGQISLTWNTDGAHQYAIQYSTDGETWETAVDHLTTGVSGKTTNDFCAGRLARYVRITLTEGTTDGFWIDSTGYEKTPALPVTSVGTADAVTDETGTAFADLPLPEAVEVTLEGGVTTTLPVTWSSTGYDADITEAQTISGTLTAIPGVTVPTGKTATVTVTLSGHTHELTHVAAQDATCTAPGNIEYWHCEACDQYFSDYAATTAITQQQTVVNALGHDYATTWSSDKDNHYHLCSRCQAKADVTPHTWNVDAATEETDKHCTVCGYVAEPKLDHTHKGTLVPGTPATCTAPGVKSYYTCTCSKFFEDEACTKEIANLDQWKVIPQLEHTYSADWSSDAENHYHVCTVCGAKKDEATHTGGEATCVSKAECSICGAEYGETNSNNHKHVELENYEAATILTPGYTGDLVCQDCRTVVKKGEVIPRKGSGVIIPVDPGTPSYELPFTDVPEGEWYYESVYYAWDADLIDGTSATTFRPDHTLTVAQAIKLAAALHQLENDGRVTLENGTANWYDTYVAYAVKEGIIESKYQSYTQAQMNAPAKRNEFVHILHGALDDYKAINAIGDNAIPDVKTGDKYAAEIYDFYRAGILTGSNAEGTFHPESSIKRSEVAAILIRIYDESMRLEKTL